MLSSATFVCLSVLLLAKTFGFGSAELPAPQATLMKLVIDGVLDQNLPWALVAIGAGIAIVCEIARIPSLPFAVGVYLPVSTMATVFAGGMLRYFMERGSSDETQLQRRREKGVLFFRFDPDTQPVATPIDDGVAVTFTDHVLGRPLRVEADLLTPDFLCFAAAYETTSGDLLAAYHRVLTGADELRRLAAAKAWSVWEGRTATLLPDERVASHFAQAHVALSMARIECHYFMHDAFLRPNQLLEEAARLEGIPGVIVHGRYDAICPLENA